MSIATSITGLKMMLRFDNRWQLIFDRLFFRNTIAVYRYKGCKIIVDHDGGDATGVRACLATDMYRQFIPLMKLGRRITLLDCGANAGGFPLLFHTEGFGLEKVVCVEMNPRTYNRLHYNLFANIQSELHCLNMIVENDVKMHRIRLGDGSTGDSILKHNTTGSEFEIPSISLNDLVNSHFGTSQIDIIKIDIEGAEHILFAGDKYDRLTQGRNIIIEIHNVAFDRRFDVAGAIRSLGFDLIRQDSDIYFFTNAHIC